MPNTSTPTIITQKKSKPMTMGELKTAVMERHGIQNPTSLEGSTREQLMKALTKPPIVKKFEGGKVKGYKKGGTLKEDKRYQEGKKTRGRMEILKRDKNKPRSIKNVATVKQDPQDKGRLGTGKKTGNKVSTVTARSRKDGKLRNKTVNLSKYGKRLPTSPIGIAALLGPIAYDQMSKTGAESFKNMKEVERGKMRKTIQNIKGTPKEIAKDKKAKKVVTAPRPKRKPKVSQNNKIKTNNLKPEVFISGDVSYDMKNQPKRMGGGKVEYKKHGGKVIKTNMSGDDVVRGCYD